MVKERCITIFPTIALQSCGMVVQQGKYAKTHGLDSPCGPTVEFNRYVGLWMGLTILKGSNKSRSMDTGQELLAYQ